MELICHIAIPKVVIVVADLTLKIDFEVIKVWLVFLDYIILKDWFVTFASIVIRVSVIEMVCFISYFVNS